MSSCELECSGFVVSLGGMYILKILRCLWLARCILICDREYDHHLYCVFIVVSIDLVVLYKILETFLKC